MLMWFLPYCCMVLSCADVDGEVRARTVFSYVESRVSYTNVAVSAEVLQPADVERWGQLLNASDAQLQLMLAQYGRFVEQHNALLDREAPRLLAASAEIGVALKAEGAYTDANSERMAALLRQGARLRRQLEQVEQHSINSIEEFLTEEQVLRLPILRNEAVRRQCRFSGHLIPWAPVDVRSLWEQVDQTWLSPDAHEIVYEILWEHDLAITPIIRSMTDRYWSSKIENNRILPAAQSGAMPLDEYVRRSERSRDSFLRSLTRLGALNENAAMQIMEVLPEQMAPSFRLLAKSAAFPQLYPDWFSLHAAFATLLEDEHLQDEVAVVVEAMSEAYDDEYRRMADRLEKFYLDFARNNVLGRTGYRTQQFPGALNPMLQQRRELSQQWRLRLAETLDEGVIERLGLDLSEPEEPEPAIEPRPSRDRPPI